MFKSWLHLAPEDKYINILYNMMLLCCTGRTVFKGGFGRGRTIPPGIFKVAAKNYNNLCCEFSSLLWYHIVYLSHLTCTTCVNLPVYFIFLCLFFPFFPTGFALFRLPTSRQNCSYMDSDANGNRGQWVSICVAGFPYRPW